MPDVYGANVELPAIPILMFAVGAIVGSFVTLVADRWPRGEPWANTRSQCRSCGHVLTPWQLIPLVSFVVQRGRCAWCRVQLPADLWLGELAGGAVALIALSRGGDLTGIGALALFGWALLLLALLDARHLWLPDAITLPLALAGLCAALVLPAPDFDDRVAGLVVGWAALEGLRQGYRRLRGREGLGGGDPKLLAGIGAWLGASALSTVVLIAALIGLAWVAISAARGRTTTTTTPIPLGTMFAIAAVGWLAFG